MKTIEVENDQLLLDIALQQYGTAEAISEIIFNNPDLKNDPSAVVKKIDRSITTYMESQWQERLSK